MCSHKWKIQNISDRVFILSTGSCPRGGTFGHWGNPGGTKFYFLNTWSCDTLNRRGWRAESNWWPWGEFKVKRLQRSGIDTIKYHTWPRIPMGKWQTHRRHHKREPRGQPFPSRWPQSTYKQTHTKHSQHKTEQKHKRSTKEVPPWNGQ